MHDRLRIDYLATFDSGNASIRWPQKNAAKANQGQRDFDAETSIAIKTNLLLKPFITVRHIELFDNLALAKFFSAHNQILKRLCDVRLIRTCSRMASSWEEICLDWALRNPQEPMHWHHLTPERQRSYDISSMKGKIVDLKSMETHLWLPEHKDANECPLDLSRMVKLYDDLFPAENIIVTNPSGSNRSTYGEMVKRELDAYLEERRQARGRLPPFVSKMAETIRECCELEVRRREFYTKIEACERKLLSEAGHAPRGLSGEVAALKAFVINEAFYQEFQQFNRYVCGHDSGKALVVANRDITEPWLPSGAILKGSTRLDLADSLEKEALPILEAITLEDILEWHTAHHAEAISFRASLRELQRLRTLRRVRPSESKVSNCIRQHIRNIRECIKRSFSASKRDNLLQSPWTEVYFGLDPEIGVHITSEILRKLASAGEFYPEFVGIVSLWPLTIMFKKHIKSNSLQHFETILKNKLNASIGEGQDVE